MEGISGFVVVSVAALFAIAMVFNRLVSARNACANARGSIDSNLKKRHDLIPNLVKLVRAYAAHERETLQSVTEARTTAIRELGSTASAVVEEKLTEALVVLEARVQTYPELKASGEFSRLARTLTELEEQMSAARRAFNAHVMIYNNLVQQFPTLLVARLTGFSNKDYFSTRDRSAPDVGAY
jgi:LemA protein